MNNYDYHKEFIFRSPQLPLNLKGMTVTELLDFTKQAFFKETIYIASPVLYDELIKWHNQELKEEKELEKLITSLYKYYTLMQSRCTPYGLFAACGSAMWAEESKIQLSDKEKRHTRLDMNYLCALAQQLNTHPVLMPRLRFYPNNSTYMVGETMRYVEYSYEKNRRVHQITGVHYSIYLERVLKEAETGARIRDLATLLISDEITEEEAQDFIQELIQSQLLVSELEPAVTGDEFSYQLIRSLKAINEEHHPEIERIILLLETAQKEINELDKQESNPVETYRTIFKELKTLETPIEENQLFQTDLYRTTNTASLNRQLQKELSAAIMFLDKFSQAGENANLKKFKENFYNQYEHAELPLLQVLDTETGIGYTGKDAAGVNKLLDDLYIPGKPASSYDIKWNKQQELLQDRLLKAAKEEQYTVVFTDEDVKDSNNDKKMLPDSIPVMFRVINKEKLFLQNCGGSSAANLLGRFAHGDEHIHHIIKTITTHEQEISKDKILAEIVHLPESRTGNILLRPVLRNYEIPYLGKSALPAEQQIQLQDSAEKLKLLDDMKTAFFREHGESKELKLQLDSKFRSERKLVEDILNRDIDSSRDILPLIELLEWKKEQVQPLAEKIMELKNSNQLQVDLNELSSSYIHMLLNRIFMSRQRTYEMVVYDLLYRYYKSIAGREKSKGARNIDPVMKD